MTATSTLQPTRAEPRLTAKGEATRARIVEIAAELIIAQGVAGTSIEDVQRAAGVSASQLYHYFGDKRGLVHAVIEFQADAILINQRLRTDRLDSFEALQAWRDRLVAAQDRRGCLGGCAIGSLASELADSQPDAREHLVNAFARWEAPISEGLRAMRDRGELRADADPDGLAVALLAAVEGGALLTRTRRETKPLEIALDTMIGHIRSLSTAAG
ncbi:TetR/AcrR family transcriptional regulator [Cryobacterium sp. PH31-O1]|uniref:TetR/AcrR family transcriptional regulator n=1 Tax=Cryobacterium sp. PH31-O1 TaxID=3046306 RepID=UPI0024BB4BE4|nr:TetR/AcrR family transcriptional regulator [Cryobacterium sp. PH31-O1]MDJ0337307.1 TetR family transcriptional regulator C-terminal domain-containing protein [Cryobacterium sp. PH31-O1]